MGWRTVGLLVAIIGVGGAGDDAAKKELAKMQGTWKVVRMHVDGVMIPLPAFENVTVVVDGDKLSFVEKGKSYEEIEIVLDVAKKPKQVDLHFVKGLKKGTVEKGIYELDGDTLNLCQSLNVKKRPTELDSAKGSAQQLMVLKRVRK